MIQETGWNVQINEENENELEVLKNASPTVIRTPLEALTYFCKDVAKLIQEYSEIFVDVAFLLQVSPFVAPTKSLYP